MGEKCNLIVVSVSLHWHLGWQSGVVINVRKWSNKSHMYRVRWRTRKVNTQGSVSDTFLLAAP